MEKQDLAQELREKLNKGVVDFSYEKTNGEWREARGTRNPNGIETLGGEAPKGTGTEKAGTIAYWDLNSEGWRSCKEDKIITINKFRTIEEYEQESKEEA
jgi:hypothetical protein